MFTSILIILKYLQPPLTFLNLKHQTMSSPITSNSTNGKRQKLVIIPPKQLFIDLTQEDNTTPSPQKPCSSPSAPNAPSKTPSTHATSTSSLPSTSSINDYINNHLSSPPTIPHPLPINVHPSLDIALTMSPFTPLEAHFSPPPPNNPPTYNPVPWSLLEAHGDTCLCCIHNRTIVFGLRDEIHYMFSHLENLLQPTNPPTNTTPPPSTTNTPPLPPSTNTSPPSPSPLSPSLPQA